MSGAAIHVDDLTPEQRKQLGLRVPRQGDFSKEECRSWVLASMATLTRKERSRVLQHSLKVNSV